MQLSYYLLLGSHLNLRRPEKNVLRGAEKGAIMQLCSWWRLGAVSTLFDHEIEKCAEMLDCLGKQFSVYIGQEYLHFQAMSDPCFLVSGLAYIALILKIWV